MQNGVRCVQGRGRHINLVKVECQHGDLCGAIRGGMQSMQSMQASMRLVTALYQSASQLYPT